MRNLNAVTSGRYAGFLNKNANREIGETSRLEAYRYFSSIEKLW